MKLVKITMDIELDATKINIYIRTLTYSKQCTLKQKNSLYKISNFEMLSKDFSMIIKALKKE